MKKLLGILVLGLGLVLNVNANAENIYKLSNCKYHNYSKTDLSDIIVDLDNKKIKATIAHNNTTHEFDIVKREGVYVTAKGDIDPDTINVKPERGNVFYRINLKYGSYVSYNKLGKGQTYLCNSLHLNNVLIAQNGKTEKSKKSPREQYKFAISFIKVGAYENAEYALKEFIENNIDHDLAGSAQYWYAETFRVREYYKVAAEQYLHGYQYYPNSDKAPINLLKLGIMLITVGDWNQGCKMIDGVKSQYPKAFQSVLIKTKEEYKNYRCHKSAEGPKDKYAKKWKKYPGDPTINRKPKIVAKKPEETKPKDQTKKKKPKDQAKKKPQSSEIDPNLIAIGSGTGFYINNKGYALTNNHVVEICKQVTTIVEGKEILFNVVGTDQILDIGLIKTKHKVPAYLNIETDGAKLGEDVIAVGYPLAGQLSDSVKITKGIVSALSGIGNNTAQIQIDAALQPGNSGGPIINKSGDVVGIASAGLNKLLMAKEAKYIPENVNFAVAAPSITNFLKAKKTKFSTASFFSKEYSTHELAEIGQKATVQLFCLNTRAAYAKLKRSKKYTDVLLNLE